MSQHQHTLLCTIGDCNGIGIEVLIRAIHRYQHDHTIPQHSMFMILTHPRTWHEYLEASQLSELAKQCRYTILPCASYTPITFGHAVREAGILAGEALTLSADMLLRGQGDAVVTMPVSKYVLHQAGYTVPGQTELFGQKAGVAEPLMILTANTVRVALTTIHIPLHCVTTEITIPRIVHRLHQLHTSLRMDFNCVTPRIAVLGVNPHAGEQGALGTEEQITLLPAIEQARSMGIAVEGAFPADGFFAKKQYEHFDGILAMYHDQGLIPIKMLANGYGVNYTAGLPFVRTSPDHGTAFDIAGKQCADSSAVLEAIRTAEDIINNRKHFRG